MIPKIIHFCWISGDPYPPLIDHCIRSWHTIMPDYQFMLWDKRKVEELASGWVNQACQHKKYAFVADYVRCYALSHFGGIYLDADVEVLKRFDDLLTQQSFIGYDSTGAIEAAIIGAEPHCTWVQKALEYYNDREFVKSDGSFDMSPIPRMISTTLHQCFNFQDQPSHIQSLSELTLYPADYFSPKNYQTLRVQISPDTYTIHHFDGQWIDQTFKNKAKRMFHQIIYKTLGEQVHNKTIRMIRVLKKKIR